MTGCVARESLRCREPVHGREICEPCADELAGKEIRTVALRRGALLSSALVADLMAIVRKAREGS